MSANKNFKHGSYKSKINKHSLKSNMSMELDTLVNQLSTLSLRELFLLQHEVVKEIESRLNKLEITEDLTEKLTEANRAPAGESDKSPVITIKSPLQPPVINREESGSLEIIEDSQDFILTQFTNSSLQSSQLSSQQTDQIHNGKENDSSPLKESQDTNTFDVMRSQRVNVKKESPLKVCPQQKRENIKDKKVSKLRVKKELLPSLDPMKIPCEPIIQTQQPPPTKKLNFNTNPLSKKPWILEDFKPNFEITGVKRGRKKIEQFYAKVGKPNEEPKDLIKNDPLKNPSTDSNDAEFIFDNLRQRSKSPPGFGRMDFPSTQERTDDKNKSQKIIYDKTIYRFYAAIDYRLPSYEREFLFKKDIFNRTVDEHNFTWSPKKLKIFLRSK